MHKKLLEISKINMGTQIEIIDKQHEKSTSQKRTSQKANIHIQRHLISLVI